MALKIYKKKEQEYANKLKVNKDTYTLNKLLN